jgi:transcriptional regulator NrdR family protein
VFFSNIEVKEMLSKQIGKKIYQKLANLKKIAFLKIPKK